MGKMKTCYICRRAKSLIDFYDNRRTKDGKHPHCKICHRELNAQWRKAWRKKNPAAYRKYRIKDKAKIYGLLPDELQLLEQRSAGRCEVCGKSKKLCIDHDHRTGVVRGLLCLTCNIALGAARESVSTLQQILIYLRRSA